MKFRITLKDPDGFYEGIDEATFASVKSHLGEDPDSDVEEAVSNVARQKIEDFIEKWVEYGEYVTLEFDTDTGTAVVVERE
jgi:hypothetical protein